MITYKTSENDTELEGILSLQKANLKIGLPEGEIESQGFVTVDHSLEVLQRFNQIEKHVIAKDGEKVVGYVLAMTKESRFDIPILLPMFEVFDNIKFRGKVVSAYNYMVVGQVCVDKDYRGKGIFGDCYLTYKQHYSEKYDFAITEIAKSNLRSLKAHNRVGFEEVHSYLDPDQTAWSIVVWDWKNSK
ncbi:GNAT family N-acetyltransferase [Pontibacter korlensis]|uniref:Acetyltransferase n=1 Tax=Pontibacter korlensis TaxID=400092 RepID=A0A0E3ZEH1_9BACT|nr:GNAT family N-acetyltransferase [Pontibacter korlensis]AKD03768.1 acetyltransferase [Pontibacter korlensis]